MSPILKYHDGTTWTEVSTAGPQGPSGPVGATGTTGPTGPSGDAGSDGNMPDATQYVQRPGDTMAGPLTLAANPVAPLETATKAYMDGMPFVQAGTDTMAYASSVHVTFPTPYAAVPAIVITNGDGNINGDAYFGTSGADPAGFTIHSYPGPDGDPAAAVRAYWVAVGLRP